MTKMVTIALAALLTGALLLSGCSAEEPFILTGAGGVNGAAGEKGDTGSTGLRGPQGVAGANGSPGADGDDGAPGPNLVSGSTTTSLTGILKGDGANVGVAVSGTDIKTINGSSMLGAGDVTVEGVAAWGSITGVIGSQTDLNTAISGNVTAGVNTHEAAYAHSDIAHANRTVLDAIQEAFTTALKTAYDWLVANVTAASVAMWNGTSANLTAHQANVSNPHSVTKAQVGLSNVTNVAQEAAANKAQANGYAGLGANSIVPTAQLGTGTPSSSTFLRGDQTWVAPPGGGEAEGVVVMAADVANATVNVASATGATFTADANSTYIIEGFILWDSSGTAVGIKISATATNSPAVQAGHFISEAAAGVPDGSSWNANDVVTTTSASPFTTYNVGKLEAILKTNGSTSVWQLRFAAETTGTITMKAGTTIRYRKVAG